MDDYKYPMRYLTVNRTPSPNLNSQFYLFEGASFTLLMCTAPMNGFRACVE